VSAQDFLQWVSELIYLAMFVITAAALLRTRTRVALDTFLFFGTIAFVLLLGNAADLLGLTDHPLIGNLTWVGIAALPYILLRLVDDFRPQPWFVMAVASLEFLAVAFVGVTVPQPWPLPVSLIVVAHVTLLGSYTSAAFLRESGLARGVTRRRMQAVAAGSGLLALIILLVGVRLVLPATAPVLGVATQALGLATIVSYFIGFAPPRILRRAWQEPALRGLLAEAADLVQLPDSRAIADRIADSATAATGAQGAVVGLWDETAGLLHFTNRFGAPASLPPGDGIGGRAFARQRPVYTDRAARDAPERADDYRRNGIRAVAAAPISSGDHRIGVLVVYAARPPAFTDDVLALIALLADEAALVLRSHQLLREAAQVRALAEITRLKDDFLSVLAHDVRTPLTTIIINAELLKTTLGDDGRNGPRATSLHKEAERLKTLVEDYLDVVSAEAGRPPRLAPGDLVALVRDAIDGMPGSTAEVHVSGEASVPGQFDAPRIRQLVQNLVGNAVKYSDPGSPVEVRVWSSSEAAELSVTDRGIGIPDEDIPLLFERFHRGTNADDRRYGGLGLGLYICRQIAEEHGGTISVSSRPDAGTTFHVSLPLRQAAAVES
jgi:signal transduction histidine kinase